MSHSFAALHNHGMTDINESPSLLRLSNVFSQINTHLTFLSAHSRSTIPTLDLVQKLNNDITKLDLGIIKHLMPPGEVFFDYCDENQIMLSFVEKVQFDWPSGYKQKTNSDDAYDDFAENTDQHHSSQLLVFDFKDTKFHGIGATIKNKKRKLNEENEVHHRNTGFFLSSKELHMQGMSHLQLLTMIKSRNTKFKLLIQDFLAKFTTEEIHRDEPWISLVEEVIRFLPQAPDLADPVQSLQNKVLDNNDLSKPSLETMVEVLQEKPFYKGQILGVRTLTRAHNSNLANLVMEDENGFPILHPDLKDALLGYKDISIDKGLYSHQTEALDVLLGSTKRHVIISTSTSSGKSLIYQLPILNDILWNIENGILKRRATAIFVFPTKALAQDQKRHLQEFIKYLPSEENRRVIVDTYDGDTPSKERQWIKSFADIIFTNPDSIHASILPNHDGYLTHSSSSWSEFLTHLKYIVMDELHVYKGTFGVHVSYIMARLNRVCTKVYLNDSIRFISCSATIQSPSSHFRTICSIPKDEEIVHVSNDGSPCSEKKLVVWNPSPLMNKRGVQHNTIDSMLRKKTPELDSPEPVNSSFTPRESIIPELARILIQLLSKLPTLKVIVFCPIRVVCENLMKEVRAVLQGDPKAREVISEADIMSYRGGYSKSDRREIEQKMFSGNLRAIIATNALELGIDLSDLDVVLTCGFPLLKANLHQQFGRAGRGKNSLGSLAIFVGGSSPIDQHYVNNIDELCDKNTYEDLCVEGLLGMGSNELVMELHLQCASYENPIDLIDDLKYFSPDGSSRKSNLFVKLCQTKLHKDLSGLYRTSPKFFPYPSEFVSIRSIEETMFAVVDITNNRNVVIEEVEASRTSFTLYEGGIFLHQGLSYLVKEFNSEEKYAKVLRVKVDWVTSQRDFTDIDPLEIEYVKQLHPPTLDFPSDIPVFFGKIQTTIIVFGFFKVNRRAEILEVVEVNNPPILLKSKGFWIDVPNAVFDLIKEKQLSPAGGIHATQHAIMNILPLYINGGASTNPNARFSSNVGESELRTECKAPEKEFAQRQTKRKRPGRLIFHDTNGGEKGSGISLKTFEHIDDIIYTTYQRVKGCECEWGCPQCVTGNFCKEMLQVMSKPAAILILASLLGLDLDLVRHQVQDGPEENMPEIKVETIERVGLVVKFSPEVEIILERKIRKNLIKLEKANEEPSEVFPDRFDTRSKLKVKTPSPYLQDGLLDSETKEEIKVKLEHNSQSK